MAQFTTASKTALALALAAALAAPAVSGAKDVTPQGRAAAFQALADCRKLKEDGARLACYDAAAAKLDEAETKGDIVVVDRAQARAARKQAFGFNLSALSIFDKGETKEEVDRVDATVDSASQDANGKWTVRLDDGAVWRQIDTEPVNKAPHHGSKAVIRRAAIGSYKLSLDGQFSIKVHRDN